MSLNRKLPGRGQGGKGPPGGGRGMGDKRSSFARSFFSEENNGEEAPELDESVPVPKARPMGRMASRRNLSVIKRPKGRNAPAQRGVEAHNSGASLGSVGSARNSGGGMGSPMAAAAAAACAQPPRNAEENWLRQSMLRQSGAGGLGFDMNAISAAVASVQDDDALESGFDDEEVLEQYRIMAQHEATLRVKANTGFDMADYEKRRKASGNEMKDKKEMFGGGKKPKIGLPPPQPVLSQSGHSNAGLSIPPPLPLNNDASENYRQFIENMKKRATTLPELSQGEVVRSTQTSEGVHVVRCWGCRANLRVNYVATIVQCPECQTVSQARKKN